MLKKSIYFFVCALMLSSLAACGKVTPENMGYDTVYNEDLGVAVSLGMSKDTVDDILGSGTANYGTYKYQDGLEIKFEDGNVSRIYLGGAYCPWIVKHGIGPGSARTDAQEAYGVKNVETITLGEEKQKFLSYDFDKNGNEVDIGQGITLTLFISYDTRIVTEVSLYR